jgi:hypothetical protein
MLSYILSILMSKTIMNKSYLNLLREWDIMHCFVCCIGYLHGYVYLDCGSKIVKGDVVI